MATEQMEITSKVLEWARTRSGYAVAELTEKFSKYPDWEMGVAYPSYPQLEQLSDLLKLPVAAFFFPEPPKLPSLEKSFRTISSIEIDSLPRSVKQLLRRAKAMQLNLGELYDGKNPSTEFFLKSISVESRVNIVGLASRTRNLLGIDSEIQKNWTDTEDALKHWRSTLFSAGIFVFKEAFRINEFSGFCLYDDVFPVIYINNSSPKTRQIFTLAHELAHLIFSTSGIDFANHDLPKTVSNEAKQIEVWCNQLASEIIVPSGWFEKELANVKVDPNGASVLAKTFHVSREVIYRRFLDLGKISKQEYEKQRIEWNSQVRKEGSGGDHYWTKISYLGRDYISEVFRQYRRNRFDELAAAEFLETKPKNLSRLEEYYIRGAA